MRYRLWAGTAIIGFALTISEGRAQTGPTQTATVGERDARVWAGPGFGTALLGTVKQGERVTIYGKEGQYYAVRPSDESRSWISHLCLDKVDPKAGFPQNVAVVEATNKVFYGPDGRNAPCDVKLAGVVERGTLVSVLGKKVNVEGKWYYPIKPLAREYRYVSEFDVRDVKTYERPPSSPGDPNIYQATANGSAPPRVPGGTAVDSTAFARAEEAERNRNYAEAGRLYTEALVEMKAKGADLATRALLENRIERMGDARGGSRPDTPLYTPSRTPLDPPPSTGRLLGNPKATAAADANRKLNSSGVGYLRASSVMINERPSYALEDGRGQLMFYATTEPGSDLNLEAYLRKPVDLWGFVQVRSDVRGAPHMVVQSAHVAK